MKLLTSMVAVLFAMGFAPCGRAGQPIVIENQQLALTLSADGKGMPCLTRTAWKGTALVAMEMHDAAAWDWRPAALEPDPNQTLAWQVTTDDQFQRAETRLRLKNGLVATWTVELAAQGPVIRMRVKLSNPGTNSCQVRWFPVWNSAWKLPERRIVKAGRRYCVGDQPSVWCRAT